MAYEARRSEPSKHTHTHTQRFATGTQCRGVASDVWICYAWGRILQKCCPEIQSKEKANEHLTEMLRIMSLHAERLAAKIASQPLDANLHHRYAKAMTKFDVCSKQLRITLLI